MVKGIGIDILEIGRMARLLKNSKFMERVFTSAEHEYILSRGRWAAESAAGIFCAKEAYAKAVGKGLAVMGLQNIEVSRDEGGAPYLSLRLGEQMTRLNECFLSISHTDNTAAAFVITEK